MLHAVKKIWIYGNNVILPSYAHHSPGDLVITKGWYKCSQTGVLLLGGLAAERNERF
jgi:hypothetical protein